MAGGQSEVQVTEALEADMEGTDFGEVERTLCVLSGHFQRNRQGQPLYIRFVCLFYILQGKKINAGQIIAHEINLCAHSANSKSPLGYPSLITYICELVRVDTSTPPFERPRKEIDRTYYMQYCLLDEKGLPIPPAQPPRTHRRPQSAQSDQPQADPYQMLEMNMAFPNAKLDAIHRGELVMLRSLASAFPDRQFISPDDFITQVAWLGEQAHSSRVGGTSSEAQAMEEDESEEEEDDENEPADDDDEEEDESDADGREDNVS
ncbi:hypothetical protein LR48_Vigan04g142500 [Vigna angularis]|uniref:Putative plant transposon protein domain-containing protein n=1 Tax=Phaseolus angularis TaxID=3914 RepID=A0A0L9UF84_PHAAN|nr:hypothetical protein LR48_Vigan04g142500 [Vigna angularis]